MQPSCRIYLITPPAFSLPQFVEHCNAALGGGDVACLQLRMKDAAEDEILRAGEALHNLCDQHGIPFIVNDSPDIALKLGAEGVHIGFDGVETPEGTVAALREKMGENALIGVSCYDSADLAMIAGEEGADYISFGAFFPTKTKQTKAQPSPEILQWWSTYTVLPCAAIGGITAANCAPLVRAGADFLAVISAVWDHAEGPAKAVQEINAAIEKAVAKPS